MDQWAVELIIQTEDPDVVKSYNLKFQTEEMARSYFNNEFDSPDWKQIYLKHGHEIVEMRPMPYV